MSCTFSNRRGKSEGKLPSLERDGANIRSLSPQMQTAVAATRHAVVRTARHGGDAGEVARVAYRRRRATPATAGPPGGGGGGRALRARREAGPARRSEAGSKTRPGPRTQPLRLALDAAGTEEPPCPASNRRRASSAAGKGLLPRLPPRGIVGAQGAPGAAARRDVPGLHLVAGAGGAEAAVLLRRPPTPPRRRREEHPGPPLPRAGWRIELPRRPVLPPPPSLSSPT